MKMAKKTWSIILAFTMAISVFSVSAFAAPGGADYSAVNAAIAANLPSDTSIAFYTDEAAALINQVLNEIIDWNLDETQQAVVDGYVTMVQQLGALVNKKVQDETASPLTFAYGTDFSYAYTYPYGSEGLDFYPLRAEENAVTTLALAESKTAVPLVSRYAGDQKFTVTLSIGSNALIAGAGIPILFDKTKLEVVGVDNTADNVSFTPTLIGSNLAQEYEFSATLNPTAPEFWPPVYRDDAAFRAQWAGIFVLVSTNFENGAPYSVTPVDQEAVLSIEFQVKSTATAGNAVIYVDDSFARDVRNKNSALYFGRAKNPDSFTYDRFAPWDTLASYGGTINTAQATATVEIVDVLLGDADLNGRVNTRDALLTLQASTGAVQLSDKAKLQANVYILGDPTAINARDAMNILRFASGLIDEF